MNEQKRMSGGVEPAWSTYIHAKGSRLGLPIGGNFELTSRCNFSCKMCYVHSSNSAGELTAKQWIDLGREAVDRGMIFLLLTGGEPFARKDFFEIYEGLKTLGLLISINTNASLIDDQVIEQLKKDPPLRMNISLYGASNETYVNLCGTPMHGVVVKNIIQLHEAGIQLRINASITPYNANDIPGIYQFADQLGVPLKATTYMFPPVRVNGCKYGQAPHRFTPEEAAAYMLQCREQYLTPEQLAHAWIGDPCGDDACADGQGDPMHCRAGRTAFWVTWDGRMLPCGMFPTEGFPIPQMGFDKAWEAVRRQCAQLRLPAKCNGCTYRKACPACAASCLTECGDASAAPAYICRMTSQLDQLTREKYGRKEVES